MTSRRSSSTKTGCTTRNLRFAKLESVLKTSLDELRMQMLGSQVLFGFQLQGLFQDNFETIKQLLTEARVILPGAQALLGFQLIVMLTQAFDRLPKAVQAIHVAAAILLGLWFVPPLVLRGTPSRRM
jgi:hypothetical protein